MICLCKAEEFFLYLVGFFEKDPNFSSIWLTSEIEKGTWTHVGPSGTTASLRGNVFASGPGRWRGMEISLGVLESSPSVLEEEGLEDGVLSPEAFYPGQ